MVDADLAVVNGTINSLVLSMIDSGKTYSTYDLKQIVIDTFDDVDDRWYALNQLKAIGCVGCPADNIKGDNWFLDSTPRKEDKPIETKRAEVNSVNGIDEKTIEAHALGIMNYIDDKADKLEDKIASLESKLDDVCTKRDCSKIVETNIGNAISGLIGLAIIVGLIAIWIF